VSANTSGPAWQSEPRLPDVQKPSAKRVEKAAVATYKMFKVTPGNPEQSSTPWCVAFASFLRWCGKTGSRPTERDQPASKSVPSYCRRKTARKLIVLFGTAATEEEEEEEEEETEWGTLIHLPNLLVEVLIKN
jgi:hypothetical protein